MQRLKNIFVGSVVSVLMFTLIVPPASAATLAELQAQVAALMAQLAAINAGTTNGVAQYEVGDRIITISNVRVRSFGSLNGAVLGTQVNGATGSVVSGPILASGYAWYRINFDFGVDGWVASANFGYADLPDEVETSLIFSLNSNSPESTTVLTSVDERTDMTSLVYEIEGDGDSNETVVIETLAVGLKVKGALFKNVIDDVFLVIDGETFDDVTYKTVGGTITAIFDIDGDAAVEVNEETVIEVRVILDEGATNFTLQTFVKDYERRLTKAAGEEEISIFKGAAVGDVHTISLGNGTVISTDSTDMQGNSEGENGEIGDFTLEFEVSAGDSDIYIKNSSTMSPNGSGVAFYVDGPGEDGVTSALSSSADKDGGYYVVEEGETEDFEVAVWVRPGLTGQYRVQLQAVNYAQTLGGVQKTHAFTPRSDYRTPYVNINGGASVQPSPRFIKVTNQIEGVPAVVSAAFATPTPIPASTGPVVVGSVNWGDDTDSEKAAGLVSGSEVLVTLKHVYAKAGTFLITLTDTKGKAVQQKIEVTKGIVSALAPVCDSFTSSRSTMAQGEIATLMWATTNATAVSINNGVGQVAVDGRANVNPVVNTTYILTARSANDKVTSCARAITITAATSTPPVSPAVPTRATSTGIVKGVSTDIYIELNKTLQSLRDLLETMK